MKDGILILNKPQDWTSHDCVAVCRRIARGKKVGHGGTLDPMAEGLLPIFIGKATKIMEYLDLDYKTYRCVAKLGIITDTQDIWGEILEEPSTAGITKSDIINGLKVFHGEIEQVPPRYSAVRVNGKRLYQYARNGESVSVKARKVNIKKLDVVDINMVDFTVTFDVTCSKGTYIRSICSDLGEALGCGGVMKALRRTGSGIFTLDNAVTPEFIKTCEPEEIEKFLIEVDTPLVHFGCIEIAPDRAQYFCRGNSIRWKQVNVIKRPSERISDKTNSRGRNYNNIYNVYEAGTKRFLGTGYYSKKDNELKADKIFDAI